ncbi:histidinol-phosphate transaminase [Pelistega sp. NLN82]|uniref:Histidinol-phosphate aminotransferase n=1 Tax=Pelistega ratti TaxID=2652177 RepID=A0A6L9Y4P9_9BURK|nr:histidinol-phosphate transaminase [Pelistega ratti]NEN75216.1 histidinol-phosphate transaminase [Pelistega ratti]
MSQFWSDIVKELQPYVPGEQPKEGQFIKLNSNESPFPPSPHAVALMEKALHGSLALYPDAEATPVREAVAQYYAIEPQQVFVGNGSDEVLAHIFHGLFCHQGKHILFPSITYSFYPVYAKLYQVAYREVPLAVDYSIDLNPYLQANSEEVSAIIFANPNAPTGIALSLSQIEQLLNAQPNILIVVDEAYVDFGAETAVALIAKYPNLLVTQTLSKSRSLAGIRVGFAFGQASLIEALIRVKNSFNSYPIDRIAQAGAIGAFEDEAYFNQTRQMIIDSRTYLSQAVQQMGFEVLPSSTNFIFMRHSQLEAAQLAFSLREKGILVRHFKQKPIEQFLRVTIGTQKNCEKLVNALCEIVSKGMM